MQMHILSNPAAASRIDGRDKPRLARTLHVVCGRQQTGCPTDHMDLE